MIVTIDDAKSGLMEIGVGASIVRVELEVLVRIMVEICATIPTHFTDCG